MRLLIMICSIARDHDEITVLAGVRNAASALQAGNRVERQRMSPHKPLLDQHRSAHG
jgi:hypothetical protein